MKLPISVLFDEEFLAVEGLQDSFAARFRLLECDGVYLVSKEKIIDCRANKPHFEAFSLVDEAWEYLRDEGIDIREYQFCI